MSAPSGRYEALGREIARAQDELRVSVAAGERASVRARLLANATPRAHGRRWTIAAATLALALAVVAVLWLPRARELTFEIGPDAERGVIGAWLAAPADEARTLRFSDGSTIELLPRAQARVALASPAAAHVVIEAGGALVHVESGAERSWQFDARPYRVRVTGTRFFVAWDPASEAFELELIEGAVIVEGPNLEGARSVSAGQLLRIASDDGAREHIDDAPAPAVEVPPSAADEDDEPIAIDVDDHAPVPPRSVAPREGPPSARRAPDAAPTPAIADWRALARAGRYRDALAAAEAAGYEELCDTLGAADLLRLADVARFARKSSRAITALAAVRARFSDTDEAATASFERGRIALAGDDHTEAASWFETYLRERPKGALAAEAMGRLIEALSDGGRKGAARETARRYLERFPKGPHADLAAKLVGD